MAGPCTVTGAHQYWYVSLPLLIELSFCATREADISRSAMRTMLKHLIVMRAPFSEPWAKFTIDRLP